MSFRQARGQDSAVTRSAGSDEPGDVDGLLLGKRAEQGGEAGGTVGEDPPAFGVEGSLLARKVWMQPAR